MCRFFKYSFIHWIGFLIYVSLNVIISKFSLNSTEIYQWNFQTKINVRFYSLRLCHEIWLYMTLSVVLQRDEVCKPLWRNCCSHNKTLQTILMPARPRPTALLPPRSYGKPDPTTAVYKLLKMGKRMLETCWAVFKWKAINLRDWYIWLVDLFESVLISSVIDELPVLLESQTIYFYLVISVSFVVVE
jgi:hypothetical protein